MILKSTPSADPPDEARQPRGRARDVDQDEGTRKDEEPDGATTAGGTSPEGPKRGPDRKRLAIAGGVAAFAVAVTDNAGAVMVVETVSDTSDLNTLVTLATERAATLASTLTTDTVNGSAVTSVTWALADSTGATIYAVTYDPATAPTSGSDLQTLLSTATGYTMSDAALAAVNAAAASTGTDAIAASAGTVTTPTGTTITAETTTASAEAASSGTAASGGTSTAATVASASSNNSGSTGTSSSSSSSATTTSGHWETVTVTAAYDETVVDQAAYTKTEQVQDGWQYVASDGYTTTSFSAMQKHIDNRPAGEAITFATEPAYTTKTVTVPAVTHVVHHDAVTKTVWVTD